MENKDSNNLDNQNQEKNINQTSQNKENTNETPIVEQTKVVENKQENTTNTDSKQNTETTPIKKTKEQIKAEKNQIKQQKVAEAEQLKQQKLADKLKADEEKIQLKIDKANRNILWLWFLGSLLVAIVLLYVWDNSRKMRFMKHQQKQIDTLTFNEHFYQSKYYEKDSAMNKLLADYNKILAENIMSSTSLDSQKQELLRLQKIVYTQDSIMQSVKKTIEAALIGYGADQLSVQMRDGKLYVTMREKLLFPSGSAQVSSQGLVALSKIAKVLKNNKNIDITIEGHTDNVPLSSKNKEFKDNWDLSVARAVEVTRILIEKYGVRPEAITAAGRSMFYPVAPNTTETGKAKNRRIEFIITPNLQELYKLIDNKQTTK